VSLSDQGIVVLGIPIPSSSPIFLTVVGVHVAAGMTCVIGGAVAMLSPKRAGRHPSAGTVYYWSLAVVSGSMTVLSIMRWPHDVHLFVLGILSFVSGWFGRRARRQLRTGWPRVHMSGMGLSYILLLTAFYVDNGPNLPVWRNLSPVAYWLAPSVVGLPILVWALLRHPLVRRYKRGAQLSARDTA
jgi:hypothetical protein